MIPASFESRVFKKAALPAAALLLAVSLTACSSGEGDRALVSSGGSGSAGYSASGEASPASPQDGNTIGSNLWLEETTDFSEGRAWVQFHESQREKGSVDATLDAADAAMGSDMDKFLYAMEHGSLQGNNRAALIDTQGNILWESELTSESFVLTEKSEFRDGMAYCVFNGNDGKSYQILDAQGNVTFTMDYDSEDHLILGHGGGLFLAAEHNISFDADEWAIGAIDQNGKIVVPFQVYTKPLPLELRTPVEPPAGDPPDPNYDYWGYTEYYSQLEAYENYRFYAENYVPEELRFDGIGVNSDYISCEYMGDHVFKLNFRGWYVLLNLDTQQVIYTSDLDNSNYIQEFLSPFEDGTAMVWCYIYDTASLQSFSPICTMGTDGTITPAVSNDWTNYALREPDFSDGLMFVPYDQQQDTVEYSDGFILRTGVFYNYQGEVVADIPEYRGKHWYSCTSMCNGYAAVLVQGADGLYYVTAVDKNGTILFDPIADYSYVDISSDGAYITAVTSGSLTVYNVQGEPLVSVQYKRIDPSGRNGEFLYNVHDSVIRVHDFYVNVESGTVIGLHNQGDENFSVTVY